MPSPEATILAKTPLPMPWGSDEIRERYAAQIRERAFFSARTIQMDYVRRLQEVCAEYAAGRINAADARTGLQAVLDELGLSDRTGALTDLGSARRLNLILRTQRQMAASAARLATQTPDTLDAWPAWRLTRMGTRAVPRDDWPARWHAAGERVGWQGAHRSQMVALKASPIWKALGDGAGGFRDAIGNPYPPFAFGSGLDWVDVSRDEALRLGLEPDGQAPQQADLSPSDVEIAEAVAKTGMGPEFFRPRPTFNRSARRAAALLITALAVQAIRNRNEISHCPEDGTILTEEGECHSSRHPTGDASAKDEAKEGIKQSPAPKHDGVKEDVKQWQEKPGRGQTLSDLACKQAEGRTFLEANAQTQDRDGKTVTWPDRLVEKYRDGKGRKQGPDHKRFELTRAAVTTVRYPGRVERDYRGNQTFYYREFGEEAVAVFVDNATHEVNGFMRGTVGQVRHSIGGKYFRRGK